MDIYGRLYGNVLYPAFESVKGRNTHVLLKELMQTQWISQEAREERLVRDLAALMQNLQDHNRYYRRLFLEHGVNPRASDIRAELDKLPVLTKGAIRAHYGDLVSEGWERRIWVKTTGGSTGEPLRFGYTKESYCWRVAVSKRGYTWAGVGLGSSQAYVWGMNLKPATRLRSLKERMHQRIDRQTFFNCFDFSEAAMDSLLSYLRRTRPDHIVGYTNPVYDFARFVTERGGLGYRPQSVVCAAEKVHQHQRELMEGAFDCRVFTTYGCREFMLIASECERREGFHVSAENLHVELLGDDGAAAAPGETGRVVVTDLHNYGFPFLRYDTGDLGVATDHVCSCGRCLPLIGEVTGRQLDLIRRSDGSAVPGELFPRIFRDCRDVRRYQVVQEKVDELKVYLVPHGDLHEKTIPATRSLMADVLGPGTAISYHVVDKIPLTESGKHRVAVSRLAPEGGLR